MLGVQVVKYLTSRQLDNLRVEDKLLAYASIKRANMAVRPLVNRRILMCSLCFNFCCPFEEGEFPEQFLAMANLFVELPEANKQALPSNVQLVLNQIEVVRLFPYVVWGVNRVCNL